MRCAPTPAHQFDVVDGLVELATLKRGRATAVRPTPVHDDAALHLRVYALRTLRAGHPATVLPTPDGNCVPLVARPPVTTRARDARVLPREVRADPRDVFREFFLRDARPFALFSDHRVDRRRVELDVYWRDAMVFFKWLMSRAELSESATHRRGGPPFHPRTTGGAGGRS